MKFNILTLFPEMITGYAGESILKRGQEKEAIAIHAVNIRDFATDKHHTVDDTPYGGGAGMVMKIEPIHEALKSIDAVAGGAPRKKTIVLSPRGTQFNQRMAEQWAKEYDEITMICGRYEGIDQRVMDHLIHEEISVGPYVLAGGELGALILTEAVARQIPGVLGNPESIVDESHAEHMDGEYPQYTKPVDYDGWKVPDVLLSGHHGEIKKWRKEQSK